MSKNFGINNIGNTCYLNSAVQLLCLNPDFINIENISNDQSIAIKKIKNTLAKISRRFNGFSQQDSGEALLLLLEHYGSKDNFNNISDYEFDEKTRIKCKYLSCLHTEITIRKSCILLLDIKGNDLDSCFSNMCDIDKLSGWKCPKCNQTKVANKRFIFSDFNKYIIIGFKRFESVRGSTRYVKNNTKIKIQNIIKTDYHIKGAIIHSGSINGGHYIAIGKRNNKWYLFNDSSVSEIKSEEQLNNYLSSSYFIMYEKKLL